MSDSEKIALKYTPANEGDFLYGVPQRDLTEAEVAALDPSQLRNMTLPGPSGEPMYTPVDAPKKAAPKAAADEKEAK